MKHPISSAALLIGIFVGLLSSLSYTVMATDILVGAPVANSAAAVVEMRAAAPILAEGEVPVLSNVRRGLQTATNTPTTTNTTTTTNTAIDQQFNDEFSIPFQLIWKLAFSNDTVLRGPTQDEYNGLINATMIWLLESVQDVYGEFDTLAFKGIRFLRYATDFRAYNLFASTLGLQVHVDFFADREIDLPSASQFLVAFSSQFDRTSLITDFLSEAMPSSSIFRNVDQLQYSVQPLEIPDKMKVTFPTEFRIDSGLEPDRPPTNEELEGFLSVTSAWFTDIFLAAYTKIVDSRTTGGSLQLISAEGSIITNTFSTTFNRAHTIIVLLEVVLDNSKAPDQTNVELDEIVSILQAADKEDYRLNYLQAAQPSQGLFSGSTSVLVLP